MVEIINESKFANEISEGVVVVDFLQHGVVHVKCYLR